MAQPFDAGRLALTGESRPVAEHVELNGPASAAFTVSDAGVLAYQPAVGQGSQLLWFDQEGRRLDSLGDAAQYGDLELSPDGRQAAVSVLDPGDKYPRSLAGRRGPRGADALHLRSR